MTQYQTVVSDDSEKLDERVNALIEQGWVPRKGVIIGFTEGGYPRYFYQTMVLSPDPFAAVERLLGQRKSEVEGKRT